MHIIFCRFSFLVCFLFVQTKSIAQDLAKDSLINLIENSNSLDEEFPHYKALISHCYQVGDGDMLKFIEKLESKSSTSNFAEGQAYASQNRALYNIRIGALAEARVDLRKNIEYYRQSENLEDLCFSYANLGITYAIAGDFDSMGYYYELENKIAVESKDKSLLATSYKDLGDYYGAVGQSEKGIELLDKSIATFEGLGDTKGMSTALYSKGETLMNLDMEASIKTLEKALFYAEKINNSVLVTRIKGALIYAFQTTGRLQDAIGLVVQNLKDAVDANDAYSIINTHNQLGSIYRQLGNDEKALENYNASIDISIERNMQNYGISAMFGLAMYHIDQGKDAKAIDLFEQIYTLEKEGENSVQILLQLLPELGASYILNDQLEKGKQMLDEALALCTPYDTRVIQMCNSSLSQYFLAKNKLGRAENLAQESLDYSVETSDFFLQMKNVDILKMIAEKKGDYRKAYLYSEDASSLKDSFNIAENQEKITSLKLNYEFDQEKAIAEAEQKAELQKAAAEKKFVTGLLGGAGLLALMAFFAYRSKAKSNQLIKAQNTQLEELSASNEQLLFSLSHDIKEPMLGLQMLLDEIKLDDSMLDDAKTSLNIQVKSVNGILRNLLDIKKNQGQTDATVDGPQIFAIIQEILDSQVHKANSKQLSIDLNQEAVTQLYFDLSPQKFYLLMLNTINNAIKYSPESGHVEIKAVNGELSIVNGIKNDNRAASVKDVVQSDGIGLVLAEQLLAKTKVKMRKVIIGDQYVLSIS